MTLTMQILTLEEHARRIRGEYLFLGLFFATLLMLGVYSFFIWYSLRDVIFLYYVFSQIGILFWFLAYSGLGPCYLWGGMPGLNRYVMFWGGGIYGLVVVQFTMLVLQITRRQTIVFATFTSLQLALLIMMAAPLVLEYGSVFTFTWPQKNARSSFQKEEKI